MPKLTRFSWIIVALLVFFPIDVTSAQDSISTDDETISVNFPDTITFELDAAGAVDIEKATLIYGTNGRSCQSTGSKQKVELEPNQSVRLAWEWELKRSGSLPPGTEIWWEWEIEDADGNVLITERQSEIVIDERYDWQTAESNGVVVNWADGDADFGNSILQIADDSLELISRDIGVSRPETSQLWVYPSSDDVQEALVYSPEWAGGVAFPEYGITILGIRPDQDAWKNQVIPHELAHLVVGELMFNCYGTGLPTWLNEGLARYAENETDERELAAFKIALSEDELPPLLTLANGFSAYGASASLSYTQSFVIVEYLIDEYGSEMMFELLDTVRSGKKIDVALEEVYGFDTAGLDVEWRRTTGFEATPTPESDAEVADATPTAIATLALVNPLSSPPTHTPDSPTTVPATATSEPTLTAIPTEAPTAEAEVAALATVPAETVTESIENELEIDETNITEEPSSNTNNLIWLVLGAIFILGLFGSLIYFLQTRKS